MSTFPQVMGVRTNMRVLGLFSTNGGFLTAGAGSFKDPSSRAVLVLKKKLFFIQYSYQEYKFYLILFMQALNSVVL